MLSCAGMFDDRTAKRSSDGKLYTPTRKEYSPTGISFGKPACIFLGPLRLAANTEYDRTPAQLVIILRHQLAIRFNQMQKASVGYGHSGQCLPVDIDDQLAASRRSLRPDLISDYGQPVCKVSLHRVQCRTECGIGKYERWFAHLLRIGDGVCA